MSTSSFHDTTSTNLINDVGISTFSQNVVTNLNTIVSPNLDVAIMVVENKKKKQIVVVTPNKILAFVIDIKGAHDVPCFYLHNLFQFKHIWLNCLAWKRLVMHSQLLEGLKCESKWKTAEGGVGMRSLAHNTFRGRGACWSSGMGLGRIDKLIHSHGPAHNPHKVVSAKLEHLWC